MGLHSLGGLTYEATWYPLVLRRLGELYEARGDREKALGDYGQSAVLWKNADPERQVADARMRMERLLAGR